MAAPRVLITAAGRRAYLVDWFRAAGALVVAADMSPLAPALARADVAVTTSRSSNPSYPDQLERICRAERIDLALSVNDLDLPVLAACRERLEAAGVRVAAAAPDVVALAADKLATSQAVTAQGRRGVPSWTDVDTALAAGTTGPWAVKPRFGSGSSAVTLARDERELRLAADLLAATLPRATVTGSSPDGRDVLIQPWLAGDEFGLDVVNDLDGGYVTTFVKRKLAMRGGETDKAETQDRPDLAELGRWLGTWLRHPGVLDVDVLLVDGTPYVLECNPRFGGGYPFSHLAGADVPRAMLAWWRGEQPDPAWLRVRPGVVGAKYDVLTAVPPR